ncbi:NnrU family protein [Aliikangiella sp. G2MR2-5]|uniref:NnrU family protein n=1 Tax=Aliikangiella sp. G2MR2-5 TaxID=2788943 RepID=UPI0018A96C66|nr:NnrU family protein [Aliikangiella sp. G2MR2-5]
MFLLVAGIVLWAFTHLVPGMLPDLKKLVIKKLGVIGYKGVFSLSILVAILMIVFGWKSSDTAHLFYLGPEVHKVSLLLMIISVYLLSVANFPSKIKTLIRHPMLVGLILWSSAHLLMNGDIRSLVLFAGFFLWSIAEIIVINRRDNKWIKPEPPTFMRELANIVIAIGVLMALVHSHIYFAGMPVHS